MIPILYSATERDFTSNGIGRLTEAISCSVKESGTSPLSYELTMELPITAKHYKDVEIGRQIYASHDYTKTADGLYEAQPFTIYYISKPLDGVVTIYGEHSLEHLLKKATVMPCSADNCSGAMNAIRTHIATDDVVFSVWTDKDVSVPFERDVPSTAWSAFLGSEGSVLDLYGGEYELDHFTLKLHTHRGADNGFQLRYGKNITGLTVETEETETYTAVVPFWKYSGEEDDVIVVGSVVYSGHQDDFDISKVLPLDLSQDFEASMDEEGQLVGVPTAEQLNTKAQLHLTGEQPWRIAENIQVSFVMLSDADEYNHIQNLQTVRKCDTVLTIHNELNVQSTMKCISTTWDSLRDEYIEIELGDSRSTISSLISSQTSSIASTAQGAATLAASNAVFLQATIGRLDATEANVETLNASKANITDLRATNAQVENLQATTAEIADLQAAQATISEAIIGRVSANEANIQDLQAGKANVGDLNAAVATITSLDGDVANIKTIMAGNVGTGTLQTITLNSANTQLDVALIRTLLANNITVNDLKAGAIDTSRFTIGEDNVIIDGQTIQVLDDNNVVRVQIGLDANDDFTFTLFDETGQGILIDADGLHPGAVPDGLIVDQMVADNANIAGSKLDIDSVITEINENGTETISSTKVWFDEENRSLNALFADMQTDVDNLETTTASQTTAIQATQGKLSALITDDELSQLNTRAYLKFSQGYLKFSQGNVILGSTAVQRMENNYNYTTLEIDGLRSSMGSMKTEIDGNIETVESKVAEYKATLDEFSTYVGETYITTEHAEDMVDGKLVDYVTTTDMSSAISQSAASITSTVTSLAESKAQEVVDEQIAKDIGVFGAARTINSNGTVTYTAQVIKGGEDIARSYPSYCYQWSTISGSTNEETLVGYGYSITVNPNDLAFGGTVVGTFSVFTDNNINFSQGTLKFSQGTLSLRTA